MIILHAGLCDAQFLIWAEQTPSAATTGRRGRKPRGAQPSPFDPAPDGLRDVAATLAIRTDDPETRHLWLPTVDGQPLASSPLVAAPPADPTKAELAPWLVTALPLPPEQVLVLLGTCFDRQLFAPGLVVGATLAFWSTALRFGAALTAREQFLPGVEQRDGKWHAVWKPILAGDDARRCGELARLMPAACRALAADAKAAPTRPALAVLLDFLGLAVDELVRSSGVPAPSVALKGRPRGKPTFDSLHDQWLHALRSSEGTLQGTATELAALAEQVHSWQRPALVLTEAPYRLCFRLIEPPKQEGHEREVAVNGDWAVQYLLQARDDPSLLVDAADAWTARGAKAKILQRDGFNPREYLLTALGQAAGLSPRIEASLKTADPTGLVLDSNAAFEFLIETAVLLEQAGFGVLLPAWWTRKGTAQRLGVRAHVKSPPMQGGSGLTLDQLVQFEWRAALGEETLTLQELETLAKLKSPLVRIRGQWVQVSAEEIQAALSFLKTQSQAQTTVRDLVRMDLGATSAPAGLKMGRVAATGWIADVLKQLQGELQFEELPPPAGFSGTLRPYQERGYSWLAFLRGLNLGACLADDMGLGKTVQTLAFLQQQREAGEKRPVLLICPMSVVGNWKKEAEKFATSLPVLVHHGLKRIRSDAFAKEVGNYALVLSSYALLHRDRKLFEKVAWAGVILDEAQNIKNPETKQAQAARALQADYRIALTGTPVENHVGDLWSIWQFLNPGFLGSQTEFRRNFFVPVQLQRDAEAAERLKSLTGPFLLRRLKTDKSIIADLPDKMEMKVFCNLTKEQASLYAAVVKELDKSLDPAEGIQRQGLILGALSKLKQVCNHPAQFLKDGSPIPDRSGKLARLVEMVEELLEVGDRALVFTQFTEMGDIIQAHLQDCFGEEVLFLHGGVARKARDQMVTRFQSEDGPRLFLLSLKAGGTGLNLTAANHVFHFDRWWNPAVENQATDRAFRIGQTRNVQVHKYVCVGTLEEKIDEMIERKQQVAQLVVGAGEAWLTQLSNEEIRDLFALRQSAVGE